MKNATRLNDEQCTKMLAKYLEMYIAVENLTVTHRVVPRTSGFDIVHELRYVQPNNVKRKKLFRFISRSITS